MLAKYYVQILGISPNSNDSIRMMEWRRPGRGGSNSVDFPCTDRILTGRKVEILARL